MEGSRTVPVNLGESWLESNNSLITLRYERRVPAVLAHTSRDAKYLEQLAGSLEMTSDTDVRLVWGVEDAKVPGYQGKLEPGTDCVLIFDGNSFVLERVGGLVTNLRPDVMEKRNIGESKPSFETMKNTMKRKKIPGGQAKVAQRGEKRALVIRGNKKSRSKSKIRLQILNLHAHLRR